MSHPHPTDGRDAADTRVENERIRRARRLFAAGLLGLVALVLYYAFTAQVDDPLELYEGLAMLVLAALPGLFWARQGGDRLPVFEVLMLTTVNTYALPLLNGHNELRAYATDTVIQCGLAVLLFQVIALSTHALVRARPGTTPFFLREVMTRDVQKFIGVGLLLCTIYTFFSVFYEALIPFELLGVLRAAFYGIGLVSTFVQARNWGQGRLTPQERGALVAMLLAQVVMLFSTLFLVGGISILALALVGYVAGSQRLPLLPAAGLFLAVALLHNGKSVMRAQYWEETGEHRQVAVSDLGSFYADWLEAGLSVRKPDGEQELAKKLFDRTSLLQIMCLVVSSTPEPHPFLYGQTYGDIPGQFIPRFFWTGKPLGQVSNTTLSVHYNLQTAEDTLKTTIGFGMLAEAYANFGLFGVVLLAFVLGAFYKVVQAKTAHSPLLSYPGLFLVVLLAWSFQTEWPLSGWLSSMFQACAAVMGIPFVLRNLFG